MTAREGLRTLLRGVRHTVYPKRCVGCGQFHETLSSTCDLCPDCKTHWQMALQSLCPSCGLRGMQCRCQPRYTILSEGEVRAPISAYYHLVPYHIPTVQHMIFALKDGRNSDTAEFLGKQLATLCQSAMHAYPLTPKEAWCIAYVPRHPMRVREKGSDQSKVLAREVSYYAKLPLTAPLAHTAFRAEQKQLSLRERAEFAEKCYKLKKNARKQVRGKYIILIDDILTSGATTAACASLLKQYGAATVVCATVAKTEHKPSTI